MNYNWNKIKNIFAGLRGITTIGIADIIGNGIGAIFWFYMATLLGAESYGKIGYFLAIGSIASTISMMGSSNMLSVYTAKNIKIESTIFLISIVAGCISSITVFFIFHDIGASTYCLGAVIFGLASAEILGKKLYKSYTKYFLINKSLMAVLAIGFYYLSGWQGVLVGITIGFLPYIVRLYKGFKEAPINFSLIKSRFGFMINHYILNLTTAFNGSIDKLIIAPILGYTILGNYQLAFQFLSVFQILPTIIYKYTLPQDASGNPNINLKIISVIISIGVAFLGIVISPIIIPIMFPKYTEAIGIIQIVSLLTISGTISSVYQSKFLGAEKSRFLLGGSVTYIAFEIPFILILGNIYGIRGVAAALVIAGFAESTFYAVINRMFERIKAQK